MRTADLNLLYRIRDLFLFDEDRGLLILRRSRPGQVAGAAVGWVSREYRVLRVDGRSYLAHRLIWLHVYGCMPAEGLDIDHINGDGLDNRLSNLRVAQRCQNAWNSKRSAANSSGYKGVNFDRNSGKWMARITKRYARHYLGIFDTPEEAYAAYCAATQRHHGEFARVA